MDQSKEYMEVAVNAAILIEKISNKITILGQEKKELEDEHGITKIKKEIKDMKTEMEATAYRTVHQSKSAQQGNLFDK